MLMLVRLLVDWSRFTFVDLTTIILAMERAGDWKKRAPVHISSLNTYRSFRNGKYVVGACRSTTAYIDVLSYLVGCSGRVSIESSSVRGVNVRRTWVAEMNVQHSSVSYLCINTRTLILSITA